MASLSQMYVLSVLVEGVNGCVNIPDSTDVIILLLQTAQDYLQLNPKISLFYFWK